MSKRDSNGVFFVYIIARRSDANFFEDAPVKVGITGNVQSRLRQIQTATPFPVGVFFALRVPFRDMARCLERRFHVLQSHSSAHGEWFNIDAPEALYFMCANFVYLLHQLKDTPEGIAKKMNFAGIKGAVLDFCEYYGGRTWEPLLKEGRFLTPKELEELKEPA
jgi:hypothetical protein